MFVRVYEIKSKFYLSFHFCWPRCLLRGRTATWAGRRGYQWCRWSRRCSRPAATGGCFRGFGKETPSGRGSAIRSSSTPPPRRTARWRRSGLWGRNPQSNVSLTSVHDGKRRTHKKTLVAESWLSFNFMFLLQCHLFVVTWTSDNQEPDLCVAHRKFVPPGDSLTRGDDLTWRVMFHLKPAQKLFGHQRGLCSPDFTSSDFVHVPQIKIKFNQISIQP